MILLVLGLCAATSGIQWLIPRAILPRVLDRTGETLAQVEMLPVSDIATSLNDSADSVDQYVAGMRAFDAAPMWSAYNDQVRQALMSQGRTQAELQKGLNDAQGAGGRIDRAVRIANYPLRDGRRYVFYIVTRSGFPPARASEEIYFIFTVDPAGKILSVV